MTTDFDQYEELAADAISSVLGRAAIISPRVLADQYSVATADPDRAEFTIRGVLSLAPEPVKMTGQRSGGQLTGTTRISATGAEFWISGADYASAPHPIRQGDKLTVGWVVYSVSDPRPTDTADINIILTREGS